MSTDQSRYLRPTGLIGSDLLHPLTVLRPELVIEVIDTKARPMAGRWRPIERGPSAPVLDSRTVILCFGIKLLISTQQALIILIILLDPRSETAVAGRHVEEKCRTDHLVPSRRANKITPTPKENIPGVGLLVLMAEEQGILSHVETGVNPAPVGNGMTHLCIDIEKIIADLLLIVEPRIDDAHDRLHQQVHP